MKRLISMAAMLLVAALIAAPVSYGAVEEFTWTGNPQTDPSVFPEFTTGHPVEDINTLPLPNAQGNRVGGTPILYGNQVICNGVFHGVSIGADNCREEGGQTICDNVDIISYTIDGGAIVDVDDYFADATCKITDIRRGPDDALPNEKVNCDGFVLPQECGLKDVMGFQPLGIYQGVVDYTTQQRIWLPEPPGWETVEKGDFVFTVDMAMTDMDNFAGNYYLGPLVHFNQTKQFVGIQWMNWGGTPSKYIRSVTPSTGIDFTSDSLGWDSLLHEAEAGALSLKVQKAGSLITTSFKAPGGTWTQIASFDLQTRPEINPDKGFHLGLNNAGQPNVIFWVDAIHLQIEPDPTPRIEWVTEQAFTVRGPTMSYRPTYWVELGGSYTDAGAIGTAFGSNLEPIDVSDDLVITSFARRAPDIVMPGRDAVDTSFPDEYFIAYDYTDWAGRQAETLYRRVIVYQEGYKWAELDDQPGPNPRHWYRFSPPDGNYQWHQAQAREAGGYVTTVNSLEENDWLLYTFWEPAVDRCSDRVNTQVAIGLTDFIVNGTYQWDNGDPVDLLNWVAGEPNNWGPDQGWGPEHVAMIMFGPDISGWERPGLWYDGDDHAVDPLPDWGWLNDSTRYRGALLETEIDPIPPFLQLIGPEAMSLGLGTPYTEQGATAFDNVDGDVSGSIRMPAPPNVNVPGKYILEYNVADSTGNEAVTVKRTVFVTFGEDERPPGLTATGCDSASGGCVNTLAIGDDHVDPGVDAFDDYDLDAVNVVTTTYAIGDIVYDVMKARKVILVSCVLGTGCLNEVDLSSATAGYGAIVLSGMSGSYHVLGVAESSPNSKLVWEQVKAFEIEAADQLAGAIDTAMGGLYVTKYNAQDNAGNMAEEVNRLVVVKDSPPTINMAGGFQVSGTSEYSYRQGIRLGGTYEELGATAEDAEDGNITESIVIGGDVVDTSTLGDYTVTYDVTDSFGNAAEQQVRTIRVYEEFVRQEQDTAAEEVPDFDSSGCFISGLIAE